MEVTIEITNKCPHMCLYCSSNATPNGKHLDKDVIINFLRRIDNIERINISGGEPLSHPNFYEILMYCYSITNNVWIYSNVIKQLIFNSDIVKEVKVESNVCIVQGKSIYIPKDVNRVHLLKLINQGRAKDYPKQKVTVSSNFIEDCNRECSQCEHVLLQADGQIVKAPCKKRYK